MATIRTSQRHSGVYKVKYKQVISVYFFHKEFAPKMCFYCSKQHPQTLTKLYDFQKTETKYVSGEKKKKSVLIWFTAEAAEKKTWKTQVYYSEERPPPAQIICFTLKGRKQS